MARKKSTKTSVSVESTPTLPAAIGDNLPPAISNEDKQAAFKQRAQEMAVEALNTLETIHKTSDDDASRITAARTIIEHAYGRPTGGENINVTKVEVILDQTDQAL